jgi:hypothetical protein
MNQCLTLSGYGAGRCCHGHIGPVHSILRCWLVMSRIGRETGPNTAAPFRWTPAAFYARVEDEDLLVAPFI